MNRHYTIKLYCPDKPGVVAAVSQFLAQHGGSITESSQHSDLVCGDFFMRVEVDAETLPYASVSELEKAFSPIAEQFDMTWQVADSAEKKRMVILVSKYDHCLSDILYRWRNQDFEFDIPCVISNHPDLRSFVEWHGIPYFDIDMKSNKAAAFDKIEALYHEHHGDLMVLARFMQILPEAMCERLFGQVINIHHSFLPSFVGAKPYHQAYSRGVKLIGATCHYVTQELDAGPIIDQDVIRVDHSHSVEDMVRLGKDVEKNVLARGLRYHVEDRVLIRENKTVVFDR